ncbi:hypothetical protein BDM02DRAFT_3184303 [Thelephora ganbajun]|uniref:Uncharacterized protein n=1 Tax=Thelephora ganbajun TaxID=370292 RepID=A0ACB6ZQK5_THEGA|nr:hypothetical protein BDM02DRAFT_3184303 [Thelephora ganbajun]
MLHLDHPSSLSPPLISHSDLPWSTVPRDNVHKDKLRHPQPLNPSPTEPLSSERLVDLPQAHQSDEGQTAGLVNDASRQSTPLSELSSPSERAKSLEPIDTFGNPDKAGTDSNHSTAQESGWQIEEGRGKLEERTDGKPVVAGGVSDDQGLAKDAVVEERQIVGRSSTLPPDPPTTGFNPSQPSRSTSSPQPSSRPPSVPYRGQSTDPIPRKQSTGVESISSTSFPTVPGTPTVTSPINSVEQKLDTKVVTILELNAELLKAGMEFQTRGVPMNDPRFTEFSKRMQSNLTWMAAVADSDRGGLSVPLPIMHPPPSVEFASMKRIYQLYSTLPTIFANDITRRQNVVARRSQSPSVSLKRDRADEHGADICNKRRDTGEHKLSSLSTSPSNQPPISFTTPNTASTPQPVTPSVSMGPPSHVPTNVDPRRQMTAMRPPMQPQQNPQPMIQSNNMQPNPAVVQPTNPPANTVLANIPPQIAAMGAAAVQYYQVLQNPSHPMVQYIINSFPGFQSLPVNQQIMKMHQVQSAISKNKTQVGQRPPQSSTGAQGNHAAGNQFRTPPTGIPPQTQGVQQPGTSFSQTFNNGMINAAVQNMVPSQQTAHPAVPNLNSMAANQRQLLAMQQMRAGSSGNATNPPLLNAQTVPSPERMRPDQPRMSPGSPLSQLPIGVGMDMNSFPIMRSNSTVPGIARSTRSPTDPTGLQGRVVSNNQEEMQRAFAAQQRNMMVSQGNVGFVNPQMLAGGNAGSWQQQVGGGMGVMGQQPQQPQQSPTQPQNFGMLPAQQPINFGSPMVPQQQWNAAGGSMQYPYPTAPSPGGTVSQQQQISPQSTMMDPSVMGDFDFSGWTNQM